MAFQTGTQVRPELGRADVSGFARAGMITGQALTNLGAQVGGAIAENRQKKEKATQDKAFDEVLVGISQKPDSPMGAALREIGIVDAETAAVARKSLGDKFQPTLNMLMQIEAESQQFQPEIITLGEGEDAVRAVRTSRGQVQVLSEDEPRLTTAQRNYLFLIDQGMPVEDALKRAYPGASKKVAEGEVSKIEDIVLSGETGETPGGEGATPPLTEPVVEPEVEVQEEVQEEIAGPTLSARQRIVMEAQERERLAKALTQSEQEELAELLRLQGGQ
jgi:hypothetical protein